MSNVVDTEFESVVRNYFDKLLELEKKEFFEDALDLNVTKNFPRYLSEKFQVRYQFDKPLFAWIDLTSRCNLRCVHCLYSDSGYPEENEFTSDEILDVADQLINDFGITLVVLTGGEVFLRPDIIDIVRRFKENNVCVKILTNAVLINDEQISQLAELLDPYLDSVQVSLDGATAEGYAKMRKTDKFDKVVGNIKKMIDKGLVVTISTVVTKLNYHEIVDVYKLCVDLGVDKFFAAKMDCYTQEHEKIKVSDVDLFKLSMNLFDNRIEGAKTELNAIFYSLPQMLSMPIVAKVIREEKYRNFFKSPHILRYRTCNLHDRLSIRADGRVYMCMKALACEESLMGNCKNQPLKEIWEARHNNVFFQPRMLEDMLCNKCEFHDICSSGCLVDAYLKTGDTLSPPENCFCSAL